MGLNASTVAMPEGNRKKQAGVEAGNYLARLAQVIDMGLQPQRAYKGEAKPPAHEVMFTYELGTEFMKDDDGKDMEDKPRWISETFPFHNLKADLAKSTKRIKAIDPELVHKGNVGEMLNSPCTVTVVNNANKNDPEKVYVDVGNVTPPMKGIPVPELKNDVRLFELDEPDMEVFESLPQWVQDKLKKNLNFNGSALQKALGIKSDEKVDPEPAQGESEGGDDGEDNPY
jgi:hypothetical protein